MRRLLPRPADLGAHQLPSIQRGFRTVDGYFSWCVGAAVSLVLSALLRLS